MTFAWTLLSLNINNCLIMRNRIITKNGYIHARSCNVGGEQTYGTPAPKVAKVAPKYYVICWGMKKYIIAEQVAKYRSCGAKVMEE